MKQILAALLLILPLGSTLLRADDVALLEIRVGVEKQIVPVTIELYSADAPATVENFKKLARKKFYNGLTIHRAFPHVLVQMGDPLTRHRDRTNVGTGGPGYTLAPEIRRKHTLGAVAMARLPDNINPSRMSNGSQFFICLKPMPEYDGKYTVFGHVTSGLDALQTISALSVDTNDNPMERIAITSLRILPQDEVPAPGQPFVISHRPWWKPWDHDRPVSSPAPPPQPSAPLHPAKAGAHEPPPASPPAASVPPASKPWWKIWSHDKQPAAPASRPASVPPAPAKKAWWKRW